MHDFRVFCASRELRSASVLQVTFAIADLGKPSSLNFTIYYYFM